MIALLALLAIALPSTNKTSWMRPESFHLTIGMARPAVERRLAADGWKVKQGPAPGQMLFDYTDTKAVTLQFDHDRLQSIRFELFAIVDEARAAFEEERAYLRETLGSPRHVRSPQILIYDHRLPNVMAVLTDDRNSEKGKSGLGVLVVRYYDPVTTADGHERGHESEPQGRSAGR